MHYFNVTKTHLWENLNHYEVFSPISKYFVFVELLLNHSVGFDVKIQGVIRKDSKFKELLNLFDEDLKNINKDITVLEKIFGFNIPKIPDGEYYNISLVNTEIVCGNDLRANEEQKYITMMEVKTIY